MPPDEKPKPPPKPTLSRLAEDALVETIDGPVEIVKLVGKVMPVLTRFQDGGLGFRMMREIRQLDDGDVIELVNGDQQRMRLGAEHVLIREDGSEVLVRDVAPGERLFEEAESWIQSTDTSWPYSFENICAALKFEPDTLRKGLENWRKERMNGRSGLYRFPFRRVNGKRHSITLRERHLRQSA